MDVIPEGFSPSAGFVILTVEGLLLGVFTPIGIKIIDIVLNIIKNVIMAKDLLFSFNRILLVIRAR
ncbi:hypothetical protein LCGC14_1839950 [marine sediment metagenome]|uniref:Uncharacterized protein n=1 Tax=marine sediment metagenome TaxID=412755 RepID=A0A0F9GDN6_9ZZZZ